MTFSAARPVPAGPAPASTGPAGGGDVLEITPAAATDILFLSRVNRGQAYRGYTLSESGAFKGWARVELVDEEGHTTWFYAPKLERAVAEARSHVVELAKKRGAR